MNLRSNNTTSERPLAISYARFSTPEQADGDSLRRQSEIARNYCEKNGLKLMEDAQYFDCGVSAYKGKNKLAGQLGKLLADAEANTFPKGTRLIVESFDRLGRESPLDQLDFFNRLLKAGLVVVTCDGGVTKEYSKDSDDLGSLFLAIASMVRGNLESKQKGARISAVWDGKRKNAHLKPLTSLAPYWLRLEGHEFKVLPERAEVVRNIFHLAREGRGRRSIAAYLNENKIPVWSSSRRNPLQIWRDSYISKILANPAVIGQYQPHRKVNGKRIAEGDPIEGYFPAIIARDEFFAVNHRVRLRKGKGGRGVDRANNLFSGLVCCHYCGGPMHQVNKGADWKYLVCERKYLKQIECPARPLRYQDVERFVLSNVRSINWHAVLSGPQKVIEFDLTSALVGELSSVEDKLTNLLKIAEQSSINVEGLAARISALELQRIELGHRLAGAREGRASRNLDKETAHQSSEELSTLPIERLNPSERLSLKTVLSHLVSRIFCMRGPDHNVLISMELNSGYSVLIRGEKQPGRGIYHPTSAFRPSALHLVPDEFVAGHFDGQTAAEFAILKKNLAV